MKFTTQIAVVTVRGQMNQMETMKTIDALPQGLQRHGGTTRGGLSECPRTERCDLPGREAATRASERHFGTTARSSLSHWVRPSVVVDVEYRHETPGRALGGPAGRRVTARSLREARFRRNFPTSQVRRKEERGLIIKDGMFGHGLACLGSSSCAFRGLPAFLRSEVDTRWRRCFSY